MTELTADELMVESMANSIAFMTEEERQNWSREAAAVWIHDNNLYREVNHQTPLPFDLEDVYDTIKAMFETMDDSE